MLIHISCESKSDEERCVVCVIEGRRCKVGMRYAQKSRMFKMGTTSQQDHYIERSDAYICICVMYLVPSYFGTHWHIEVRCGVRIMRKGRIMPRQNVLVHSNHVLSLTHRQCSIFRWRACKRWCAKELTSST